jgi:hypothetical protein
MPIFHDKSMDVSSPDKIETYKKVSNLEL